MQSAVSLLRAAGSAGRCSRHASLAAAGQRSISCCAAWLSAKKRWVLCRAAARCLRACLRRRCKSVAGESPILECCSHPHPRSRSRLHPVAECRAYPQAGAAVSSPRAPARAAAQPCGARGERAALRPRQRQRHPSSPARRVCRAGGHHHHHHHHRSAAAAAAATTTTVGAVGWRLVRGVSLRAYRAVCRVPCGGLRQARLRSNRPRQRAPTARARPGAAGCPLPTCSISCRCVVPGCSTRVVLG